MGVSNSLGRVLQPSSPLPYGTAQDEKINRLKEVPRFGFEHTLLGTMQTHNEQLRYTENSMEQQLVPVPNSSERYRVQRREQTSSRQAVQKDGRLLALMYAHVARMREDDTQ